MRALVKELLEKVMVVPPESQLATGLSVELLEEDLVGQSAPVLVAQPSRLTAPLVERRA